MKYDIIIPTLIAFGVSVILSPIIIPFLKKLKFGQFVQINILKELFQMEKSII